MVSNAMGSSRRDVVPHTLVGDLARDGRVGNLLVCHSDIFTADMILTPQLGKPTE